MMALTVRADDLEITDDEPDPIVHIGSSAEEKPEPTVTIEDAASDDVIEVVSRRTDIRLACVVLRRKIT